ncbi:glycosyltransferase [Sphingomonas sp. CCH9-F2]|nr:glycosyltransferase [Sphingomonas sp. CCH9-F2]
MIDLAWRNGFDRAIVSDVEYNEAPSAFETRFPGLTFMVVPSPVRQQRLLYRFTDLLPQIIWHHRAAAAIRQEGARPVRLWIANSAQPWLPLGVYQDCFGEQLIWGPVGGGGTAPARYLATCDRSTRWREWARTAIERLTIAAKVRLLTRLRRSGRSVTVMARTREVAADLAALGAGDVPVVSEIVAPLQPLTVVKTATAGPRLVWVGQDIPRKNLAMALDVFAKLRARHFPAITLDIHGVADTSEDPAVTYHGWTAGVPWDRYREGGVLLLTSYREGLPSAVLEALQAGLSCVSTDVGAVATLRPAPLFLIPMDAYPNIDDDTLDTMASFIRDEVARTTYRLEGADHAPSIARLIAKKD